MRRLLNILINSLVLSALLFAVGCTKEQLSPTVTGEEAIVSFSLSMDNGIDTRAIADGELANQLVVLAKDSETKACTEMYRGAMTSNLSLRLIQGRTYTIVFWAQNEDAYTIADGKVTANYTETLLDGGFAQMKSLDAFSATRDVTAGETQEPVKLYRSVAQLNFADNTTQPIAGTHKAVVTFANIPETLDLFTGEITATAEKSFTFSHFTNEKLTTNEVEYHYVASNYILAPMSGSVSVAATLDLQNIDGTSIKNLEFKGEKAIKLTANKRTNILGSIVQQPEMWSEYVEGAPQTTALELDNNNTYYTIDEAADIAWLSDEGNASTLEEGKAFVVTTNIDMSNSNLSSLQLPSGSTIMSEGGGKNKIIKNMRLGGALFGNAMNTKVENLDFEGITVESQSTDVTHVGVLVNTLKGYSKFTNVTVSNSSVSTANGAAGGIVGYVVRENETDRNETLAVTFDNCHVAGVNVDGTISEGHFVGLLSGYDNGEVLTFNDNCSYSISSDEPATYSARINNAATKAESEFVSPYSEGNEATWLANNNYSKYNGWLGNEKYYRGIVNYGSNRFVPKWDGVTKIKPLTEDGATAIYSAFDLANLQGGSYSSVVFKTDVDLGGVRRENEWEGEATDRGTNPFNPINSIINLDGENHTIHNLYIELKDWIGGFILYGQGTHKNLKFNKPSVIVHFVTVPAENNSYQDHAYAGTLTPYVCANYTAENIKINDGFVFGMGKIGGMIGVIEAGITDCKITDCNVSGTTVKNKYGVSQEVFKKSIDIKVQTITVEMKFYSHGEAGGLIGMIRGNAAIKNCHVTGSTMDCFGEADQTQTVKVLYFVKVPVTVPGRHVNNFIGDIRTQGYWIGDAEYSNVVTIDDCSATNNTYVTTDGKRKDDSFKGSSGKSTNLVGTAYYLKVEYKGIEYALDPKGSVTIDGANLFK